MGASNSNNPNQDLIEERDALEQQIFDLDNKILDNNQCRLRDFKNENLAHITNLEEKIKAIHEENDRAKKLYDSKLKDSMSPLEDEKSKLIKQSSEIKDFYERILHFKNSQVEETPQLKETPPQVKETPKSSFWPFYGGTQKRPRKKRKQILTYKKRYGTTTKY